MFWKCCESADFKEKHWFKMATPKVTFQTCCSNSLMFGLIWAIFLPGNVVFIMATHPVSIISIIFYTWLCFYGKKTPICYHFDWLLSKTIETDPNLLYFWIFLQVGAWNVYQSTVKVIPTIQKHQRNTNCTGTLLFDSGIWSYISSYRTWSYLAVS